MVAVPEFTKSRTKANQSALINGVFIKEHEMLTDNKELEESNLNTPTISIQAEVRIYLHSYVDLKGYICGGSNGMGNIWKEIAGHD